MHETPKRVCLSWLGELSDDGGHSRWNCRRWTSLRNGGSWIWWPLGLACLSNLLAPSWFRVSTCLVTSVSGTDHRQIIWSSVRGTLMVEGYLGSWHKNNCWTFRIFKLLIHQKTKDWTVPIKDYLNTLPTFLSVPIEWLSVFMSVPWAKAQVGGVNLGKFELSIFSGFFDQISWGSKISKFWTQVLVSSASLGVWNRGSGIENRAQFDALEAERFSKNCQNFGNFLRGETPNNFRNHKNRSDWVQTW